MREPTEPSREVKALVVALEQRRFKVGTVNVPMRMAVRTMGIHRMFSSDFGLNGAFWDLIW